MAKMSDSINEWDNPCIPKMMMDMDMGMHFNFGYHMLWMEEDLLHYASDVIGSHHMAPHGSVNDNLGGLHNPITMS